MEVFLYIFSVAVILFIYRKWDKESKEHEKYFLQQCKDVSEIKDEIKVICRHCKNTSEDILSIVTYFDKLDGNSQ